MEAGGGEEEGQGAGRRGAGAGRWGGRGRGRGGREDGVEAVGGEVGVRGQEAERRE